MNKKDLGYLIKSINDKLKVKADADLKRYNLTFTQSRVFAFLHEKGGLATQKEVELFLEVSHPTVVGIISRMEQNGYVETWFDEKDKRNKCIKLTKKAEEIGINMEQHMLENEKLLLSSLSEGDAERLKEMLFEIYKNLD